MNTPYSEVYDSVYGAATTISATTGEYGLGAELEETTQKSTAVYWGSADTYSRPMSTSYLNVPYGASELMSGSENRILALEPVPASSQLHGPDFGHGSRMPSYLPTESMPQMMWTPDNAQLGSTRTPLAAPQSVRPSCPKAPCRWRDEKTSVLCFATLSYGGISDHFKYAHGVKHLHESERIDCKWEGCAKKVGRKNFVRHIREHHLKHSRDKSHSALGGR